jgi:NAD(P)-dependent dehydrogenase (short-subunit alcohol dehydrogenase family)
VAIVDVDDEALAEAAGAIAAGGALLTRRADVSLESELEAAIEATVRRFGNLTALINNAARRDPVTGPLENLSLERWSAILATNLTGAFLGVKHAVRHLRASRGSVVNIASTRALMSEPDTEAYAASKGGLLALTHALAISLGPEVRVNAVSPGWIDVSAHQKAGERAAEPLRERDHAQHPAGRVGRPEDVAAAVAFLIGDGARFITGQNLIVDGGMTRKMIYED